MGAFEWWGNAAARSGVTVRTGVFAVPLKKKKKDRKQMLLCGKTLCLLGISHFVFGRLCEPAKVAGRSPGTAPTQPRTGVGACGGCGGATSVPSFRFPAGCCAVGLLPLFYRYRCLPWLYNAVVWRPPFRAQHLVCFMSLWASVCEQRLCNWLTGASLYAPSFCVF